MAALWQIELLGWLRAVPGRDTPSRETDGSAARQRPSVPPPDAPGTLPGVRTVDRFRTQKGAALLAFLAYHPSRSHPRDVLVERLWPDARPPSGRVNLRRQLEPPGVPAGAVLLTDRATVQLNPAAVTTDVAGFEAALQAAARSADDAARVSLLIRAVEWYQGELLPGFFDDWVLQERLRLGELHLHAVEGLAAALEQQGDLRGAIQWARRGVSADPRREEAQHQLIRLLAAAGEHEAARRQYQELEALLQRETGTVPAIELRALAPGLLPAAPPLADDGHLPATPSLPALPADHPPEMSGVPGPALPRTPAGTVTWLLIRPGEEPAAEAAAEGTVGETALPAGDRWAPLRALCGQQRGSELPAPDGVLTFAFSRPSDAATAAMAGMRAMGGCMALHTAEAPPDDTPPNCPLLERALSLLAAAPPGGILLSPATAELLAPGAVPPAEIVDRGLYRLRPDAPPERVFQLVDPQTPPLPLLPPRALPGHAGQLPLPFTRFFGREAEIGELCALLCPLSPHAPHLSPLTPHPSPLVTLTGLGGSGKTRLAVAVAARLQARFPGGVWFVPLADLTDPALIPDQILAALHVPRSPGLAPLEQLMAALTSPHFSGRQDDAARGALLVLDNLEQLLEREEEGETAAPHLLQQLRERVPSLTLLVTSRRRLNLPGEQEFPLAPLPVPALVDSGQWLVVRSDPAADPLTINPYPLTTVPSVALFVDRAQATHPDFQLTAANAAAVAQLCVRLEGIPLAIELAAARVGVLTPSRMLDRLSSTENAAGPLLATRQRGISARHQSLRAALDWSYQLLSPDLQRFFARLSVFRGGWTVEAAEAVCGEEGVGCSVFGVRCWVRTVRTPNTQHPTPTLDCLEELRECSLVVTEEEGPGGGGQGSGRAPASLSDLTPDPWPLTPAAAIRFRMLETLREFAAEQLSAAERQAVEERHTAYFLGLAEECEARRTAAQPGRWLEQLEPEFDNLRAAFTRCQAPEGDGEVALRLAHAMFRLWSGRGSHVELRQRFVELLGHPHAQGRTPARAWVLKHTGTLTAMQCESAAAVPLLRESLALFRALSDRAGIAAVVNSLALVAVSCSEMQALYEESLAIGRELGDLWRVADQLYNLSLVALWQGEYGRARALAAEAMEIWSGLKSPAGVGTALGLLAALDIHAKDLAAARRHLEEALDLFRRQRNWLRLAETLRSLGCLTRLTGDAAGSRSYYMKALALAREVTNTGFASVILLGLAELALDDQCPVEAERLLREVLPVHRQAMKPGGPAAPVFVRQAGVSPNLSRCLDCLAWLAERRGEREESRALHAEMMTVAQTSADFRGIAAALEHRARVLGVRSSVLGVRSSVFGSDRSDRSDRSDDRTRNTQHRTPNTEYPTPNALPRQAALLLGAADALRRRPETLASDPLDLWERDRCRETVRAALDEATFTAAWTEGQAVAGDRARLALLLDFPLFSQPPT